MITYLGLQLFGSSSWILLAFDAANLTDRIERDRPQLEIANAELLSSRVLLAESSRFAERLEISRELHDSLGDHLTILNLELEVGLHAPANEKNAYMSKAQFLARLLLADLRDTVTSWRTETSVSLPEALRALASGLSGRQSVCLENDPELPLLDAGRAHALLRCSQEALTNALRHAAARRICLSLANLGQNSIKLEIRDDGKGAATIKSGCRTVWLFRASRGVSRPG